MANLADMIASQFSVPSPGSINDKLIGFFSRLYTGQGTPEGVVTATPGAFYFDLAGGLIYSKATGSGNTGWGASSGGGVSSVDALTGAVDLSGRYLSLTGGAPQTVLASSIGATSFTPPANLTTGNRFKVTTTATPTAVNMPSMPADTKYRSWVLMLKQDGTGGWGDPTFDAKVTWIGNKTARQAGANKWDLYLFDTEDGGTTWNGWHMTAAFSVGANYVTYTGISAASVPTPAVGSLNFFVDSADGIAKFKDSNGELFHAMFRAATTAPTNTAVTWVDLT